MPWGRLFAVWAAIAVLMILLGTLRETFLTPAIGALRAHQVGSVAGCLAILAIAYLTLPWLGATGSPRLQLTLGAVWLATTVIFEFGFGHWVGGHSWERLLADYDLSAGRLWSLVLATTALGPWFAGRLRGP